MTPRPGIALMTLATFIALASHQPLEAQSLTPDINIPVTQIPPVLLSAADRGDNAAQYQVGELYFNGTIGRRSYADAFKWFMKASQSNLSARSYLGESYLVGSGTPQDLQRGISILRETSDAADPVGLRFLARAYEQGLGTERNQPRAAEIYLKAINAGDIPSLAFLGVMMWEGRGGPQNLGGAYSLFKRGADQGEQWAQLNLGMMYRLGSAPSPDALPFAASPSSPSNFPSELPIATVSNQKAAFAKNRRAPDYAKAFVLFEASAKSGNRVAAFQIGQMYSLGQGVPKDVHKAFMWYELSAARRYAPAQREVGRAHELGEGIDLNLEHAYVGYKLAAAQNDLEARSLLAALLRRMSQSERDGGEQLYQEFRTASGYPSESSQ